MDAIIILFAILILTSNFRTQSNGRTYYNIPPKKMPPAPKSSPGKSLTDAKLRSNPMILGD